MALETFVENAKAICKNKGVSVSSACIEAGLSVSWLSDIEHKNVRPRIDTVMDFAHYLGVTVSDLLGETKPRAPAVFETFPETAVLRDSAITIRPDDFRRLSLEEMDMVLAYRTASSDDKTIVDAALRKYKKGTTAETG